MSKLGKEQAIPLQLSGKPRPLLMFFLLLSALCLTLFSIRLLPIRNGETRPDYTDVIWAIDVSRSMRATDVSPSRLQKAVDFSCNVVKASGQVRFGIVAFNTNVHLHAPLTSDTSEVISLLRDIPYLEYPDSGTDILSALQRCSAMFSHHEHTSRNIILVSDGESRSLKGENGAGAGINLYIIGVGTIAGSKIPDPESGRYLVNSEGKEVISKLNEAFLQDVAEKAGGRYFRLNNSEAPNETELLSFLRQEHAAEVLKPGRGEVVLMVLLFLILVLLLTEILLPGK